MCNHCHIICLCIAKTNSDRTDARNYASTQVSRSVKRRRNQAFDPFTRMVFTGNILRSVFQTLLYPGLSCQYAIFVYAPIPWHRPSIRRDGADGTRTDEAVSTVDMEDPVLFWELDKVKRY